MKNIILTGVPRSGKTAISKKILNEFKNYSLIQGDVITSSYVNMCGLRKDTKNECIELNMSEAYQMVLDFFNKSIEFEPNLNYLLDYHSLKIEDIIKYLKNGYLVIVFGYPDATIEELVENTIKYDEKHDWTYTESVRKLELYFDIWIKDSNNYKEDCMKNNIKFVNVSKNREDVLNNLLDWIKENNS